MSTPSAEPVSAPLGTLPVPDPLRLLGTEEVAALLGVAAITLRIWRLHGCGPPYIKLGRSVKYKRLAIESFLDSCSRSSTSESAP